MVHRSEHHKETWFAKTMCSYIAQGEPKKTTLPFVSPYLETFSAQKSFLAIFDFINFYAIPFLVYLLTDFDEICLFSV